jgi:flagellar biosynthesis/type III secretory pathway protein FliH
MVAVVQRTLAEQGSEAMQTVADYWIEQGIEQGIERGIEQGIEQGRIQNLHENILELLNLRFGLASEDVAKRVTAVTDIELLRQLLRTAATAPTTAVFLQLLNDQ